MTPTPIARALLAAGLIACGPLAPAGTLPGDGAAISALGQVTGTRWLGGPQEACLLTLHPDGQGGSGHWNDAGMEVGGPLNNWGTLTLKNAELSARGGISNYKRVGIAGNTSVHGPVENGEGSLVNVSGIASHGMFWDHFSNDGSVNFEASALAIQLGGTTPGSGPDKLVFGGAVGLGGASLQVLWLGGWAGQAGDHYDLFDWNGGFASSFASISLPTLGTGLGLPGARVHRRSRPQN